MILLLRPAVAVLLAGVFTAAVLAVPAPPPPKKSEVKDRAAFIPTRKHQTLAGTVVGVLVSDVGAMMSHDGRSGPPDAIGFSTAGYSYRWVYVPAEGKPLIANLSVKVGPKGDNTVVYPALDMANPETVKRWGVTTPYALVEMEVNDSQGAPADESFVGTHMKRLDGTREYPLEVPEVIASLKDRYAAHVKDEQKRIDAAMDEERKVALKDRKATGPRETAELMYVTWLPESKRLRVCFRTTITDGAYQYGNGVGLDPRDPAPPKLGPRDSPRFPAPGSGVRFGTTFGVEFGAAYEVAKSGKLVLIEMLPIQSSHRELPPPPAPGGPLNGPRRIPLDKE
jgi:hypothetical protein